MKLKTKDAAMFFSFKILFCNILLLYKKKDYHIEYIYFNHIEIRI